MLGLMPTLAVDPALRAAVGGIALIGVSLVLRRPMPKDAGAWGMIVLLASGATSLGFLGMFHGSAFLSPGLATLIFSTQPLVAAVLGRMFLGEQLTARGALGLVLGFTGVAIASWPQITSPSASLYLTGAGFVIAAAAGTAIAYAGTIGAITGQGDANATASNTFGWIDQTGSQNQANLNLNATGAKGGIIQKGDSNTANLTMNVALLLPVTISQVGSNITTNLTLSK